MSSIPGSEKSATFPWRGVVNMRGINSQTRACNYPLTNIENILVKQGQNKIFSIMDLRQAFHQQPLAEESRPLTCTNNPSGVFQWRFNVMGLTNAPIQFQQMLDDVVWPVEKNSDAYIDDILTGTADRGKSGPQHMSQKSGIFQRPPNHQTQ